MASTGKTLALILLSLTIGTAAFGHGMSEADQARAAEGGFGDFFPLGATHMLTGYDHLLFLFGVVFFLTKFRDILKYITAFTLGHCVTLIGATFLGIRANYFLVDAVIALTVCYKGFDNLDGFKKYMGVKMPNLVFIVFVFGLIHGFGLSTRLQQLTIGEGMDLLGKIISFNIGVEAGQVAALAIILVFLLAWRKTESFQKFSAASNTGLIVVGGLLFIMQLHGYSHETGADSFPLNLDAHGHAHRVIAASNAQSSLQPGWHLDEGDPVPHKDHDHTDATDSKKELPAGWHVDEGDPVPHKAHEDHAGHDHTDATDSKKELPAGWHLDEGDTEPHKDHDHDDHDHDDHSHEETASDK